MAASHPHSLRSSRTGALASWLLIVLAGLGMAHAEDSVATGKLVLAPGAAAFADRQGAERFGNAAVEARWTLDGKHLVDLTVTDRVHGRTLQVPAPFALVMADGSTLRAADMNLLSLPRVAVLPVDARSSRLAGRIPGKAVEASFGDANGRFRVDWKLVQRDGSPYLREEVGITALRQAEKIAKVLLLETKVAGAEVEGTVNGSPVVAGDVYLGFENPLSESTAYHDTVKLAMARTLPLEQGKTVAYSAVVGVVRDGQLRRDFNSYVERERAHPYRTFLHYNSWYDIGYFTPYTEAEALDRINTFGRELAAKRGVKLDSFLFDDGWDDRSGSWNFSKDFPHGFVPLREAAAKYDAAPGIWLSPWGGYGKPWQQRVKNGKAAGYETNDGGFALSGPKYYQRFHQVVMDLLDKDGVNQFKFDGTGNADKVFPGSVFDSDFGAAIQLIEDIRAAKPDMYINLTTGTTASPFWLRYADSIWRDGEDDDLTGVGSKRERWITYRDRETYRNI
ncbi:MAG TPA: enterotoxin, partial [Rhodanobacter sp.]